MELSPGTVRGCLPGLGGGGGEVGYVVCSILGSLKKRKELGQGDEKSLQPEELPQTR